MPATGRHRVEKVSLVEFAKANPQYTTGTTAWITMLPEWEAIRDAWVTGAATGTQIREWLIKECGYPESEVTYARTGGYLSKTFPRTRRG